MADAFWTMFAEARERVLTRYADQAEASAADLRDRKALFPDAADQLEADAVACEVYAAECRAAVADPSLPSPSGPNYVEVANRG